MSEWRDIRGFEGKYQVSSDGEVRSLDRIEYSDCWKARHRSRQKLALRVKKSLYVSVNLYSDGHMKSMNVHRLVANAFIENDDSTKTQVNHKNGIKSDNRVENLEWVTPSENVKHSFAVLGREPDHHGRFTQSQIKDIRESHETQKEIARRYGVSRDLIGLIRRGKIYKEEQWESLAK